MTIKTQGKSVSIFPQGLKSQTASESAQAASGPSPKVKGRGCFNSGIVNQYFKICTAKTIHIGTSLSEEPGKGTLNLLSYLSLVLVLIINQ
jgi:hypothetical protein